MRYTQNIKLPIVEDNDLYSKEINNLAFEKIDEEIQGLADIVETLDSPENSIADVKKNISDRTYFYSPEMFGKTGTSDDTQVIQSMFDYIAENNENGADVKFLNKVYKFRTVTIMSKNVNISGGILDGTLNIKSVETLTPTVFNILNINTRINNVTFKASSKKENAIILEKLRDVTITNCSFDNYNTCIVGKTAPNFKWQRTARVSITNCKFYNFNKAIVTQQTTNDGTDDIWTYMQHGDYNITNNYFYGSNEGASTPVDLNGQDGLILKNNFVFCGYGGKGACLKVSDSNFVIIEGNNFFESYYEGLKVIKPRVMTIKNNNFAWCGQGRVCNVISITGWEDGSAFPCNIIIDGNNIQKSSGDAIEIGSGIGCTLISNNFCTQTGTNSKYFDSSLLPKTVYDIKVNPTTLENLYMNDIILNSNYGVKGISAPRGHVFNQFNHNHLANNSVAGGLKYGLTFNGVVDFSEYIKDQLFNKGYPFIFKECGGEITNIINVPRNCIIIFIANGSGLTIKHKQDGTGQIKNNSSSNKTLTAGTSATYIKTDNYLQEI